MTESQENTAQYAVPPEQRGEREAEAERRVAGKQDQPGDPHRDRAEDEHAGQRDHELARDDRVARDRLGQQVGDRAVVDLGGQQSRGGEQRHQRHHHDQPEVVQHRLGGGLVLADQRADQHRQADQHDRQREQQHAAPAPEDAAHAEPHDRRVDQRRTHVDTR